MNKIRLFLTTMVAIFLLGACSQLPTSDKKDFVDYVNPYIGNISHLLVPTFPTIQLPNSMLRVYPERSDYTSERINGLPIIVTNHRERSAFNLTPYQGEELKPVRSYTYDNEKLTPYSYEAEIDDNNMAVKYAVSHQSAIYHIEFRQADKPVYVMVNSRIGKIHADSKGISGYQQLSHNTRVFLYIEPEQVPVQTGILVDGKVMEDQTEAKGRNACAVWRFADGTQQVNLRYGISFISEEQAKNNLYREQSDYNLAALASKGRDIWNKTLSKIAVKGGSEDDKTILYSSYYRTFERPICMSEDGRYFSAFDGQVHEDNGVPFYTDDWIWDTYRAAHPLRLLIEQKKEEDIIDSYLRMAEQMGNMWMPTFPEVTGDSRRMNSNHAVVTVADAIAKGLKVDIAKAYEACRKGIEEKTLVPWSAEPAGWLDKFYHEHGYIPALQAGEKENDPNVTPWEKRQPIAVTLGTAYDQWCLHLLANALGKTEEAAYYLKCARNYRNVYRAETGFFHPKDKNGKWSMCVFDKDGLFNNRWVASGGKPYLNTGEIDSWICVSPEGEAILVFCGGNIPDEVCWYKFQNNYITYTCPVENNTVLDIFIIPNNHDINGYPIPLDNNQKEID